MLNSLPDFLSTYWMYLAGVAVVLAVVCYFSEKMRENIKKCLIVVAVIFGLMAGYELVTGNSIFTLPGRVDKSLSEHPKDVETNRRYYKSHKERFGDAMPDTD